MRNTLRGLLAALALMVGVSTASADVKLAKIFSDNMVLQQKTQAPVWGWADAGETVKVTLGDKTAETKAGDNGRWQVKIETPAASFDPQTLTVRGKNEIVLKNVLIGEVWIGSGQSNMQWSVAQSANAQEEIQNAQHPHIRLFTVARGGNVPQPKPIDDLPQAGAKDHVWLECNPENARDFSAVAYFFGRHLQSELKVPIGLINTSWGGTICEAWTSNEALAADPDWFGPILERSREFKPGNPNQASVLYNSMIHPLVPFAIRGAIWYQGESNVGRAEQYARLFPAMITDWRKAWGQGDFPFLFVQLAPYCYGGDHKTKTPKDTGQLAELWDAQVKTLELKNTGMAVTTDITDLFDIHPRNKQDVGRRLALWALANTYGKSDITYSGPLYESMKVENGAIRITFKHGQGLKTVDGQPPLFFQIAGDDQKFVDAEAKIDGETVIVRSKDVASPVAVRFAWKDYAAPNLVNGAGLPASPFRTDDWKLITAGRR